MWDEAAAFDRVDRAERCDPERVAALWQTGLVIAVGEGPAVALAGDAEPRLAARPAAGSAFDPEQCLLAGRLGGRGVFVDLSQQPVPATSLRAALPLLAPAEAELAATAAALANWHRLERFCPACGSPARVAAAGAARQCPGCGRELFPRTDPAVIVAVTDPAGRLLLARQRVWEPGRCSVLAGFVEAGESLEQAVRREVAEEVGVQVGQVEYVASQPWPMPRSLMLGFTAQAANTDLRPDGEEIAEARWVARGEIGPAVASGELTLPGRASIAYRLIRRWLDGGRVGL